MELGLTLSYVVVLAVGLFAGYKYGYRKGWDKAHVVIFDQPAGSGAYNRDGGLRGDREPPRK